MSTSVKSMWGSDEDASESAVAAADEISRLILEVPGSKPDARDVATGS